MNDPDQKKNQWNGFTSEEGDNTYKNYELKTCYDVKTNIPQLLLCSSKSIDRFHCHAIKRVKTSQWKK